MRKECDNSVFSWVSLWLRSLSLWKDVLQVLHSLQNVCERKTTSDWTYLLLAFQCIFIIPPTIALLGRGSLLSTYDKRKRDGIELKSVSLDMGRTSQSVESEMGVFQEQLHSELEKDNFPRNHDYDGALKGLIVIHNTYRFELFSSSSPESCVT